MRLKNSVESFGEIVAVFSDPGVSAKNMNRPGFQKMLHAIGQGQVDLVLVTELSQDIGIMMASIAEFERRQMASPMPDQAAAFSLGRRRVRGSEIMNSVYGPSSR